MTAPIPLVELPSALRASMRRATRERVHGRPWNILTAPHNGSVARASYLITLQREAEADALREENKLLERLIGKIRSAKA